MYGKRDLMHFLPALLPSSFFKLTFPPLLFSLLISNPFSYPVSIFHLSTFLFLSSLPVFVSPSHSFYSSPRPSVYPIWLSHLSWELSQRTGLLIQFLLNLMALCSAFAIPATCSETKPGRRRREKKGRRKTEKHKNLSGSLPKVSLAD